MLDLKAKLLEAGLVTEDDAQRVEREEADKRAHKAQKQADKKERARWQKRIAELQKAGKSEQYETLRGWVQRTRLDPEKGLPSEEADRFHFETADGKVSWLTLEPDVKEKVSRGEAGIIAWMSFNGLKHCVVPADVARDVGAIRPEWVRHLDGFDVVRKQDAAPASDDEAAPASEPVPASEPAPESEPAS